MLWLGLYFPHLPLEVFSRGQAQAQPLAVTQQQSGRDLVNRCNEQAASFGIRPGISLASALALCGGLQVRARDASLEQQALHELALWAYQFSSRMVFEPLALILEVGGSLRLFGGKLSLLNQVQQGLDGLGYQVQMALAPTPAASGLLARLGRGDQVERLDELAELLRPVPIRALTRDQSARALLEGIGMSCIGDCLRLPRAELSRRLGPELMLKLDRLLGRQPDPRPAWQPPEIFRQNLALMAEVEHTQALAFPAQRLLTALHGFLRGRGAAAQTLDWRFQHRDLAPTCLTQGLLAPSQDAAHLLALLRERLERLELPAPVQEISLEVRHWQEAKAGQEALFSDQESAVDTDFLERLRAKLGEQSVRGLAVQADFRPEKAWRYRDLAELDARALTLPAAFSQQPLWLLEQPQPLRERSIHLQGAALRLENGWWDGEDQRRDYYLAHDNSGQRLWVFQDLRSGGWYVHGLFD